MSTTAVALLALDQPAWLAALPAAAAVVWLGLRRPGVAGGRGQRWATGLRAAAVALLVLALAGPRWGLGGGDVDVVFLLDASDSVSAADRAAAQEWIRTALAGKGSADRAALALFGRDVRLEHGLREDPPATEPAVVVDPSGTDLARALRLGQGVLGSERRRRVVLLTDGRPTQGDLVAEAERLASAGVGLDIVTLKGDVPADVFVEEVLAPSRVREGEAYEVVVGIRNTGGQELDVELTLAADGATVDRRTVTAAPGRTDVVVARTAEKGGQAPAVRYEARLASGASTIVENDVGRASVRIDGPPKVLVFERTAGLGGELAAALRAAEVPADLQSAEDAALPPLDRLLDYDSVVLVDVPAARLGEAGMLTLDAYVRDAGHGLVAVGGEESFGMGQYDGTPLEELLPVFARITDPRRRPAVAQALVVDTSGSMAACHCRPEGMGGPAEFSEGGVVKTDIAKEAVARAIDALEEQDQVGVLAFDTASDWVIPLQHRPAQSVVDDGLARLHPKGDTDIGQAVREAIDGLRDVDAQLRHVVLFTDGFMNDLSGLVTAAEEARDAGLTLSVVGTGEGSFDELRRVADIGGGRYYPGRDLQSIPEIIALEVRFAARPIVTEGRFVPVVTGIAPATENLDATPPLRGYLATTAKPVARTLLSIGDERDPLLASWQAGLGTTVAWTSDVAPRWSAEWIGWDGFRSFWADVVKQTFPAETSSGAALRATATAEGLRLMMEVEDAPAEAVATVTVTGPDGNREQVALERTGLDRFAAVIPANAEGVYAVAAVVRRGDDVLYRDTATALRSYSPEYVVGEADAATIEHAVAAAGAAGGGQAARLNPEPAAVFSAQGLPRGSDSHPLWPWLALAALMLATLDVGLRRLRLERGDAARLLAWLRRRRPGAGKTGPGSPPRDAATDALFAARSRARRGPDEPADGGTDPPQ